MRPEPGQLGPQPVLRATGSRGEGRIARAVGRGDSRRLASNARRQAAQIGRQPFHEARDSRRAGGRKTQDRSTTPDRRSAPCAGCRPVRWGSGPDAAAKSAVARDRGAGGGRPASGPPLGPRDGGARRQVAEDTPSSRRRPDDGVAAPRVLSAKSPRRVDPGRHGGPSPRGQVGSGSSDVGGQPQGGDDRAGRGTDASPPLRIRTHPRPMSCECHTAVLDVRQHKEGLVR